MDEQQVRDIVIQVVKSVLEENDLGEDAIIVKKGALLTEQETAAYKIAHLKLYKTVRGIRIFLGMVDNRVMKIIAVYAKITFVAALLFNTSLPDANQLARNIRQQGIEFVNSLTEAVESKSDEHEKYVVVSPNWSKYNQTEYNKEVVEVIEREPTPEELPEEYVYVSASGIVPNYQAPISSSADDFRS